MDISDVITVYALNVEVIKSSVPVVVILLVIPALLAIGYLWKRINQECTQYLEWFDEADPDNLPMNHLDCL